MKNISFCCAKQFEKLKLSFYSYKDYALKMFHDALTTKVHHCYLEPDTRLPMMYIDDILTSTLDFLEVINVIRISQKQCICNMKIFLPLLLLLLTVPRKINLTAS